MATSPTMLRAPHIVPARVVSAVDLCAKLISMVDRIDTVSVPFRNSCWHILASPTRRHTAGSSARLRQP
eukprot:347547-Pleurochrysis_carterae.AAC.2